MNENFKAEGVNRMDDVVEKKDYCNISKVRCYLEWSCIILLTLLSYYIHSNGLIDVQWKPGLFGLTVGLMHIIASNVLSQVYNYGLPEFLSFFRATPRRLKVLGVLLIIGSIVNLLLH